MCKDTIPMLLILESFLILFLKIGFITRIQQLTKTVMVVIAVAHSLSRI